MGLGTSMLLIAIGAIMKFALHVNSSNVEIETVGMILMIVGIIGALLSLAFWGSWGGAGIASRSRRTTVYDDAPAVQEAGVSSHRVVRDEVRDDRL
jgi:sulfite exporter TauE/SafE